MTSFFPRFTSAANGEVVVTWLDGRNDPANVNYEPYATGSTNGGTSFLASLKLTGVMSTPLDGGFGGGFIGDYTGNTVAGSTLYASWMDMRNGSFSQDWVAASRSTRVSRLVLKRLRVFRGPFLVSAHDSGNQGKDDREWPCDDTGFVSQGLGH